MAPPAKRFKVLKKSAFKKPSKPTHFTGLNKKCMISILQWLPTEDLISVGQTCKVLRGYAGLQYQRDHPNHSMAIEMISNHQLLIKYKERSDISFSRYFQHISVSSYIFDLNPMPLFKYVQSHSEASVSLMELSINRLDCSSKNHDYGDAIKMNLENLETISFNGTLVSDIHTQFLVYCKNLQHLRIKNKAPKFACGKTWLETVYRTLHSLTFWVCDKSSIDYIRIPIFFQNNRNIKHINCMGLNFIAITLNSAIDLDVFIVHCEMPEDLERISSMLCQYSKRFRRVEIVFHYTMPFDSEENVKHIKNVSSLPSLQGFHGLFSTDNVLVDRVFTSMENLRSLSLKLALDDRQRAWKIVMYLPRLQTVRLYIKYSLCQFGSTFKPLTIPFLARSKQLGHLIVSFTPNSCVTHPRDIIDLHNARIFLNKLNERLNGACPTTIFLAKEVIVQSKFIIPNSSLIRVKPMSSLPRNLSDPFLF
ncbi:uncharacterized protein LOC116348229 [Contarinia nasturtii]|uniref:uncharacterized protein LOC116348229 n=1 Tax=Contarinia nasturtii TaxID=265458 RepID=UPI0012D3E0EE|nr:uncharacterized protein LOC116348229 [Contarinia nasturtii]